MGALKQAVKVWGISLAVLAGGFIVLVTVMFPATRQKVTIVNRTEQPLRGGTYGPYDQPLGPAEPPLDLIPPHTTVTHMLRGVPHWTGFMLHYEVMGRHRTVPLGYDGGEGGTDWSFISAEGDTLVVDSMQTISRDNRVVDRWKRGQVR